MRTCEDPFIPLVGEMLVDGFAELEKRDVGAASGSLPPGAVAVVGCLHGFDLLEQPLVAQVSQCPGQVLVARSTVHLRRSMIGSDVVLLFEDGDVQRPIVMGVIEKHEIDEETPLASYPGVVIETDGERHVVSAEREIVLRCGDASITLTRAGKVIIKGNYILSRSTGYNKIKGAAIDIN